MATICNCCGSDKRSELFKSHIYTLVRCEVCNLHYIDPMPDNSLRLADVHAGRFGNNQHVIAAKQQLAAEESMEKRLQMYVDLATRFRGGGRFLDVGCGAGFLMVLAARAGFATEGIELTADRYELAGHVTGSTIHDKTVEELAFSSTSFDVITLINVFSHLADPSRTLIELGRILKPGGVLVLATGEIDGQPVRKNHLPEWTLGDEMYFLGHGTINAYAKKAKLSVVEGSRTWLPDSIYSRERFKVRGRSRRRNAIKRAFLIIPGALPTLRYVVKRSQADNPIYSAVFVLQKDARTP